MTFTVDYADYSDRVHGGWLGKSLGGVVGAPYENKKQWCDVSIDKLWPEKLAANDDLDIQVVWLEAMQARGVYISHKDMIDFWQDRCSYNFCEYGHFLHNVQRGIMPPLSGHWNNEYFRESEGCPIRSEIWGFICPGNPQLAAEYAQMDAELDHSGASVRIERFLSAAAAMAVVSDHLDAALAAGCSVVPADCPEVLMIEEVRKICRDTPEPKQAWRRVIRRWGDRDASKGITNHAIVLMSLFLGDGDFKRTIQLCVNAGWDVDCTAATAGALLGALTGTAGLPNDWREKLGPNLFCGIPVEHKTAPLDTFSDETCRLGVEMAMLRNGAIAFRNAPDVELRHEPGPVPEITVSYPGDPVLYGSETTDVVLSISNPTGKPLAERLRIRPAPNTVVTQNRDQVMLGAGSSCTVLLRIAREDKQAPVPDVNLFTAVLGDEPAICECVFGLGGARQWLAYGPYWDMWDRTANEVCPYHNDEKICLPGEAGFHGDNYNHYVELDRACLDEAALLSRDLPEEVPFAIEAGEDVLDEKDLGGFCGAACYYLVRTIQAGVPGAYQLVTGRCGPMKVWVDGDLVYERKSMRCWAIFDEMTKIELTGQPQRIVVKLARQSEVGKASLNFIHAGERADVDHVTSNLVDSISDLPPQT